MGVRSSEVFAEIGPWQGETTEEIMAVLTEARREGESSVANNLLVAQTPTCARVSDFAASGRWSPSMLEIAVERRCR